MIVCSLQGLPTISKAGSILANASTYGSFPYDIIVTPPLTHSLETVEILSKGFRVPVVVSSLCSPTAVKQSGSSSSSVSAMMEENGSVFIDGTQPRSGGKLQPNSNVAPSSSSTNRSHREEPHTSSSSQYHHSSSHGKMSLAHWRGKSVRSHRLAL